METKKLLSVSEVALQVGIGRTLTYKLINEGAIKSIRLGHSRRRVPAAEVETYVQRQLQQCEVPVSKPSLLEKQFDLAEG